MQIKDSGTMKVNAIRRLRIELGLTQQDIADLAQKKGDARDTFTREVVSKADSHGTGLGSYETRSALADGLGLSASDLNAYLAEAIDVNEAVRRSSITPDPEQVRRLRRKYLGPELTRKAPASWDGIEPLIGEALEMAQKVNFGRDWALAAYLTTPTAEPPPAEGLSAAFLIHKAEMRAKQPTSPDEQARFDGIARTLRDRLVKGSATVKLGNTRRSRPVAR